MQDFSHFMHCLRFQIHLTNCTQPKGMANFFHLNCMVVRNTSTVGIHFECVCVCVCVCEHLLNTSGSSLYTSRGQHSSMQRLCCPIEVMQLLFVSVHRAVTFYPLSAVYVCVPRIYDSTLVAMKCVQFTHKAMVKHLFMF